MSFHEGLVSVLKCDHGKTHAIVFMTQHSNGVLFQVFCKDLPAGKKGFHVHEKGNLIDYCKSLGSHYNPDNERHGDLNELHSHRGDLGNIIINENGTCDMEFVSYKLTLNELIGRSLVIHSKQDDLGHGGNTESLITGNSGSRLCCGIIGYA